MFSFFRKNCFFICMSFFWFLGSFCCFYLWADCKTIILNAAERRKVVFVVVFIVAFVSFPMQSGNPMLWAVIKITAMTTIPLLWRGVQLAGRGGFCCSCSKRDDDRSKTYRSFWYLKDTIMNVITNDDNDTTTTRQRQKRPPRQASLTPLRRGE